MLPAISVSNVYNDYDQCNLCQVPLATSASLEVNLRPALRCCYAYRLRHHIVI